jgi:hypothetical protein
MHVRGWLHFNFQYFGCIYLWYPTHFPWFNEQRVRKQRNSYFYSSIKSHIFFPLSRTETSTGLDYVRNRNCLPFTSIWVHHRMFGGIRVRNRNCLPITSIWVHHRMLGGIRAAHHFSILSYFLFVFVLCHVPNGSCVLS